MRVAYVFPGQGAQSVGMGRALYEASAAARGVFEQADRALGEALTQRCFMGPEDELRQTIYAQPAIVAVSTAAWAALGECLGHHAPQPAAVAGHSVGAYSALVAAGVTDLSAALALVRERARSMHEAARRAPGAMAAVLGLPAEAVEAACADTARAGAGVVVVANYNAADQVVISGEPLAVEQAGALAKERGARRVVRLAVSGAFHSPLMDWAVGCFAPAVAAAPLRPARTPVISNISGQPLADEAALRAELAAQVRAPVQWAKTMDTLVALRVTHVVELGPGQVLSGLLKRRGGVEVLNVDGPAGLERAAAVLHGRL